MSPPLEPTSPPTYLYKLIPHTAAPPHPLPDALPLSALDASSGFIHLSTAAQLGGTLGRFFADAPKMYILKLRYAPLRDTELVRWEDAPGGEGVFPHLYNGMKLGKDEVEEVGFWERDEKTWEEVAHEREEAGWLVW
ncbi:hypothetical protein BDW22DRAFT_1364134 [Trametopsis cervina]|nr:hypothetical protein BDW22DRAFT_1364134 [Trametopsis cervina]